MTDGTSNTFLFGEYASKAPPVSGWGAISPQWMGAGMMPTAWGLVSPANPNTAWYRLDSKHTNIVMFSMGDGAVRSVRYVGNSGTGFSNFIYASGSADGQVLNTDNF